MNIKQFLTDIRNLGKTKKFWSGLLGAVGFAALTFIADQPQLGGLVQVLGVLGIYQASNNKK